MLLGMLGKHVCHFLTKPDSLVYSVYKAWHFKNGSFLTAQLANNPSYIWRGIFQVQEFVRKGARKGLGNGEKTLLFHDPWLPNSSSLSSYGLDPCLADSTISIHFNAGGER